MMHVWMISVIQRLHVFLDASPTVLIAMTTTYVPMIPATVTLDVNILLMTVMTTMRVLLILVMQLLGVITLQKAAMMTMHVLPTHVI
jgi:hypothetical protein